MKITSVNTLARRTKLCGVLLVLASLAGCGGPSNVGRVTGKVTLDGQPLADAVVTFSPVKEGGSSGIGKTDSTGAYALSYAAGISGAEIGENRVTITTITQGKERVPMEYNSKSTLKAEVKSGAQEFNWDLKGGGAIYSPEATGIPPVRKKR